MSSSQINNNTFLSRVFGTSLEESHQNPEGAELDNLLSADDEDQQDQFGRSTDNNLEVVNKNNYVTPSNISRRFQSDLQSSDGEEDEDEDESDEDESEDDFTHRLINNRKKTSFEPSILKSAAAAIADFSRGETEPNKAPTDDPRLRGNLDDEFKTGNSTFFDDLAETSIKPRTKQNEPLLPIYETPVPRVKNQNRKQKQKQKNEQFQKNRLGVLSPREKALWMWANVENLDTFLQDCYDYYLQNGFWCIIIKKITDLLTAIFLVYFSTYLGYCIDYSKLSNSKKLSEVTYGQCYKTRIHGFTKLFLFLFYIFVIVRCLQFWFIELKKLKEMRSFFQYLLRIEETELQTISWQLIIKKLIILRDTNPNGNFNNEDQTNNNNNKDNDLNSKTRLTAHDIANRIMRKENYLVCLYNKDILNFEINLPIISTITQKPSILTKTLEWNLNLCVIGFAFNEQGQFKPDFLKEANRIRLSKELSKRFLICGILGIFMVPLLAGYFILLNFFRFFYEFRSNPQLINNREFSPFAEWKFREYNELYHFFKKRIYYSNEYANEYLNQFPKERMNLVMKFISFISGALVTVLVLLTLFDPDLTINFEITENKSILFYMGILGTIWAISHGSSSNDNEIQNRIFDPEFCLKNVANYTHYLPKEWENNFHTDDVKNEFSELYQLKIILILKELLSIIFIPFIFWFALPKSSDKIIDFFRECTIHVNGLGYVCSYAMFDIENKKVNDKNKLKFEEPMPKRKSHTPNHQDDDDDDDDDDESFSSGNDNNKMLKSYLYFVESYANQPETSSNMSSSIIENNSKQSMYYSKQFPFGTNKANIRNRNLNNSMFQSKILNNNGLQNSINNFIGDESYLINLKEPVINNENKDDGVLGMINNYYNHKRI